MIEDIAEKFQNKDLSPVELTKSYLAKIRAQNSKLNVYITVLEKEALAAARESDKRYAISHKRLSKIDGIPIAIKDNILIESVETTAASKILEGFVSPYDATVISKLKEAGAVIIGKTNLDEFAMGSSTENSYFGPTKNPFDETRVPGGSSGGSAAAVAAEMCVAALGSDTGGSIRQPASFCGVVGFKPTYGAVSRYGLIAMASSLDQIGPIAKTVEDAEILFKVIAGYDERDSTSNPKSDYYSSSERSESRSSRQARTIKIGVPREYFGEGLNIEVKKVIEAAIKKFKKMGAEIKEIALPNQKYALSCYQIIMAVEAASNLARYDGIKYGLTANGKQQTANRLLDVYINNRSEGFGEEAKRRIMLGTYASSAGYIGKYYHKAQKVRALIKKDFDEAFREVDFILGPTAPEVAFKIGQKKEPLKMYLSDIYTLAVSLAGLPAISIPAGFASNQQNLTSEVRSGGLPVGLQIIGPQFSDFEILEIAKMYEGTQDGI